MNSIQPLSLTLGQISSLDDDAGNGPSDLLFDDFSSLFDETVFEQLSEVTEQSNDKVLEDNGMEGSYAALFLIVSDDNSNPSLPQVLQRLAPLHSFTSLHNLTSPLHSRIPSALDSSLESAPFEALEFDDLEDMKISQEGNTLPQESQTIALESSAGIQSENQADQKMTAFEPQGIGTLSNNRLYHDRFTPLLRGAAGQTIADSPIRLTIYETELSQTAAVANLRKLSESPSNEMAKKEPSKLVDFTNDLAGRYQSLLVQDENDKSPMQQSAALRIDLSLHDSKWGQAMVERVTSLSAQNIKHAKIALEPANLGPMDIEIQINGQKASVIFGSEHHQVRDLIEVAVPRLKEMFAEDGLDLINTTVGDQSYFSGGTGDSERDAAQTVWSGSPIEHMVTETNESVNRVTRRGLVDDYA